MNGYRAIDRRIKDAIQWDIDPAGWWESVIMGAYQQYYEKMYG
jgi:hypothetical protein